VLAVEDLFLGTLRSDPSAHALGRLQEVYGETVRFHGGDPTIGPCLRALLSASGLVDVQEETVVAGGYASSRPRVTLRPFSIRRGSTRYRDGGWE
jgi:hypothetical protein